MWFRQYRVLESPHGDVHGDLLQIQGLPQSLQSLSLHILRLCLRLPSPTGQNLLQWAAFSPGQARPLPALQAHSF